MSQGTLPSLPPHLLTRLSAQQRPLSFPLALAAFTLALTTTLSSSPLPGLARPRSNPCWPRSHPCHPRSRSRCLHPRPHCPHFHSHPCRQRSRSIPRWSRLHPSAMALGLITHSPPLSPGTFVTLLAPSFAHHWTCLHYGPLASLFIPLLTSRYLQDFSPSLDLTRVICYVATER